MHLKLAVRRLLQSPFVSLVAVASLALGIGANAAIYSLFDQALLRSLPVARPGELVNLSAPGPKPGSQSCGSAGDCDAVFSYPMFRDLEQRQAVFSGVAAHVPFGVNLAYRGQTFIGRATLVSGSYFPTLGVRPALGRLLGPGDDRAIGAHDVTVLSHEYWTAQLGGNPAVLNDTILVNGRALTIVGVSARGFRGTTLGAEPRLYVPLTMRAAMLPGWTGFDDRRAYWAYLFARLKPGLSIEQAGPGINTLYRAIVNDIEAPLQKGMSDATMARFRARALILEAGGRGQSAVHREARVPMMFLMAVTGIVLLIACANIANLLLARGAGRASEMALRLSLGAGRGQLVAQLLTESSVLALLGGAAGLLTAQWTLAAIASMLPPEAASSFEFGLNRTVVLFTAALSLATGIVFGLFPALHATKPDLVSAIKAQAGQPSGARAAGRFRTTLVTAQIAMSMALLVAAGLFVRSLVNISRADLGMRVDNVVTFGLSPDRNGYDAAKRLAFFERMEQELAALPGVTGVTAATVRPLSGDNWGTDVGVEGFKREPDTDANSRFNLIGPDYFRTFGVPLVAGREFTTADRLAAPKVAIVNEAFTRKFGLGRNAVGRRIGTGRNDRTLDIEIVGVVRDAKYSDVKQEIPPVFFVPWRQNEQGVGSIGFYVRTAGVPAPILRAVPPLVARLDAGLPVEDLKTMTQQVRETVFLDRMIGTLAAAFAVLATVLAAIGLYGVLAYSVSQRTREIGLRMALGADGPRVRGMIMRQVAWMTLAGGAIGLAGAWALGRGAEALLFQLKGFDPGVTAVAAVLLALTAFGAGYLPAWRASRVHPMEALRYE